MFVLRSAFWLTIGFMIVAPHGVDLGATANAVKDKALAAGIEAGEKLVASQVLASASAALVSHPPASASLSAALPMQDSSATAFVTPRSRPLSMG